MLNHEKKKQIKLTWQETPTPPTPIRNHATSSSRSKREEVFANCAQVGTERTNPQSILSAICTENLGFFFFFKPASDGSNKTPPAWMLGLSEDSRSLRKIPESSKTLPQMRSLLTVPPYSFIRGSCCNHMILFLQSLPRSLLLGFPSPNEALDDGPQRAPPGPCWRLSVAGEASELLPGVLPRTGLH